MAVQAYTAIATVKSLLSISDTTDDTALTTIVNDVNEWVEATVGFPVGPITSEIRSFDGAAVRHEGRCLPLYPWGVRAISAVKTRDTTGGTQTTLGSTDYFIRPHSHERETGWPGFELWISDESGTVSLWPTSGYDTIEVTATWGWDAIPPDLAGFATRLAISRWRRRAAGASSNYGVGPEGDQLVEDEMTPNDRRIVERYRALSGFTVQ